MRARTRFLLEQLASEAAEVAHIALKAAQFGPNEVMPGQPLTNVERVAGELVDLFAVMGMLDSEGILSLPPANDYSVALMRKRAKVERYMAFALDGAPHPMAERAVPVACNQSTKEK